MTQVKFNVNGDQWIKEFDYTLDCGDLALCVVWRGCILMWKVIECKDGVVYCDKRPVGNYEVTK